MINKLYSQKEIVEEMKASFEQNGVLVLDNFLIEECYKQTEKTLLGSKTNVKKVADKFSYGLIESGSTINLLESKDFETFIEGVLGKKVKKVALSAKRFGHRDYTLIHDEDSDRKEIQMFFFICDNWKQEWGGYKAYIDSSGKSEPMIFVPKKNVFCLIEKGKNWNEFVKYVNNHARGSFILVEGVMS